MKTFLLAVTACAFLCSDSNSQIVVNEIMFAPADATNEWFEILNAGNDTDIQNWKWKDATATLRTITNESMIIAAGSFLIVCQDSSKFRSQYPFFEGILMQSSWSALNNSGDNLILFNSSGNRVDSVPFSSAWGGSSGYSLERKNPSGSSVSASNWGTSVSPFKATPGSENSILIREFDLELTSFTVSPVNPVVGGSLQFGITVHNAGIREAVNSALLIYDDVNLDSTVQSGEMIGSEPVGAILPGDSAVKSFTHLNALAGVKQFIAYIDYPSDLDTGDNGKLKRIFVSQPGTAGSIVINEIMYDPLTGMAEWIELLNPSGMEFDMKGWKLKDNSSEYELSDSSLILTSGSYLLIAADRSIEDQYPHLKDQGSNTVIVTVQQLSLNNGGEALSVEDSMETVIDAVEYSPSMHNPDVEDPKGVSLERISPSLPTSSAANWSSSAEPAGGTPGRRNSIFADNIMSQNEVTILPNPFSPDGDGFEDNAVIKCIFGFTSGTLRAGVYDIRGRLVRTLANNELTGSEKIFLFNGYADNSQRLGMGLYIIVVEVIDNNRGVPVTLKAPLVVAGKL